MMNAPLRIKLFGLPNIMINSRPTPNFPAEKVKYLFFYLVLFRHIPHTRSALASVFWGERTEAQARHSLNTAVWRLRQWLETLHIRPSSFVLVEDKRILFNSSSPHWLDTGEFEQCITRARQMNDSTPDQAAASLRRAIELYRGDLMEGCYTDWCLAERHRLQLLFFQALLHLMVYHGGRREYTQAITFAQRLLQDDPLREDIQRELMKLFILNDQPAEALSQYGRCEKVLREELGIESMPETQEIFHQLILKSGIPPIEHGLLGNGAHETPSQLTPFSQKIDAALQHFEAAREELDKGIAVLHEIRNIR